MARPAFDPEIARALEQHRDIIVTSMAREDIPRVRGLGADVSTMHASTHAAFDRLDLTAPGVDGARDVDLVVLRPAAAREPVPVIMFLHGGGMVAGTADSDLDLVAELAYETGCAVVSAEYRLAPEDPYPAALEDAVSALTWVTSGEGPDLLDPQRVVLAGISAGGGLAASTALFWRDRGGAALAGLMLLCPMLDHRSSSCSARQMVGVGSWDATANATAWEAYLNGADPAPYASPSANEDLGGLPPTFIDVGSAETFRDECVEFASRIWERGGDAELHVWPGGAHAFDVLAPWAQLSQAARLPRSLWLQRRLERS
ncbi:esterase [Demequina activiva]|uniref:Esterase n=2 Tax=Demequina activiva TaxID=1582364 RepID=A0A919Q4H7_9MICO|nr:esterase [Demequina activiva]